MPKVVWSGVNQDTIENYDRESQIQPYDGPPVPNGLYHFVIKVLKYRQGKNLPQLMIGLEILPRADRPAEKKYKRFFIMDFAPVADHTAFRWVPFLDAIGVTARDFLGKMYTDEEGNVTKIGKWTLAKADPIAAMIGDDNDEQGNARKRVAGYFAIDSAPLDDAEEEDEEDLEEEEEEYEEGTPDEEDDEDEDYDDEDAEEEDAEEEEEEEYEKPEPTPPPRKRAAKKAAPAPRKTAAKKAAPAKRRRSVEPPF